MRVLLSHPTYPPEAEGAPERLVAALAAGLAERGHEVTVLSSQRGARQVAGEGGVRVIRRRRPRAATVLRRYEEWIESAPGLAWELRRERFDIWHAVHPLDAYCMVALARVLTAPSLVYTHARPAGREYLVDRRYRLEMLSRVAREAAAITVPDGETRTEVRRYLLREPLVLPTAAAEPAKLAQPYEALYEELLG
ncbi:MAG: glycosyltransferase family 4 protein [Solirubrobacterales bacterium]